MKLESPEPAETPAELRPTPTSTLTRQFTGPFTLEYAIEASFVAPDRFDAFIRGPREPFAMIAIRDHVWIQLAGNVKTLHYTFSEVLSEDATGKILGEQSDTAFLVKKLAVDLWLAENDHWPVRMDIGGSGLYADGYELRVHILVDIRDANSGDMRVEPPS